MSRVINFEKKLSEDEAQYVLARPWLIEDQRILGVEIKWPSAATVEEEPEEEEIDYNDLSNKELKAEIDARNQDGRSINPISDKKADLVFALEQDDVQEANTFDPEG